MNPKRPKRTGCPLTGPADRSDSVFFNTAAFDFPRDQVIPQAIHQNADRDEIRIGVAGYAAGEDSYSIARMPDAAFEKNSGRNFRDGYSSQTLETAVADFFRPMPLGRWPKLT